MRALPWFNCTASAGPCTPEPSDWLDGIHWRLLPLCSEGPARRCQHDRTPRSPAAGWQRRERGAVDSEDDRQVDEDLHQQVEHAGHPLPAGRTGQPAYGGWPVVRGRPSVVVLAGGRQIGFEERMDRRPRRRLRAAVGVRHWVLAARHTRGSFRHAGLPHRRRYAAIARRPPTAAAFFAGLFFFKGVGLLTGVHV